MDGAVRAWYIYCMYQVQEKKGVPRQQTNHYNAKSIKDSFSFFFPL